MPADQRNFNYSQYVSDDATTYCLKADQNWITDTTDSGSAACTTQPPYGRATKRRVPRKFIFRDPTTFRTLTVPVFTTAAYAAGTVGTLTQAVHVPGLVAPVTYTLVKKVPERVPSTVIGRQDSDHP